MMHDDRPHAEYNATVLLSVLVDDDLVSKFYWSIFYLKKNTSKSHRDAPARRMAADK